MLPALNMHNQIESMMARPLSLQTPIFADALCLLPEYHKMKKDVNSLHNCQDLCLVLM